MTSAIQIKLLVAILAVLGIIAGVLVRQSRTHEEMIRPDAAMADKVRKKMAPSAKPYLVP